MVGFCGLLISGWLFDWMVSWLIDWVTASFDSVLARWPCRPTFEQVVLSLERYLSQVGSLSFSVLTWHSVLVFSLKSMLAISERSHLQVLVEYFSRLTTAAGQARPSAVYTDLYTSPQKVVRADKTVVVSAAMSCNLRHVLYFSAFFSTCFVAIVV